MRFIVFIGVFLFSSCLPEIEKDDDDEIEVCTELGSTHTLEINLVSATPLPKNLRMKFNSNDSQVDECNKDIRSPAIFEFKNSRRSLELLYTFEYGAKEDFLHYFNKSKASTDILNIEIFNRDDCLDTHIEHASVSNIIIDWKPVYANGEDCAATSYSGKASVGI